MDRTLSRRERKKQDTRQRLMDAARELFRKNGFEETTVEEIAERADVAKGTFFNYFPSKEALLNELALRGFEQLSHRLDLDRGAPASPVARIKLLARLIDTRLADDLHYLRQAMETRTLQIELSKELVRSQFSHLMHDLVNEAQLKGEIRLDIEAAVVGDLLHVAMIHEILFCRKTHDSSAAEKFERMVDLMLDGLAGPQWRME